MGAVVVAVNEEVCKKALAAIKVDWEVLPFILDPREAAKPGAPILRPEMNPDSNMTGNTFGAAVEWELGCAEDGFKEADHIDVVNYGRPMWSQFRPMPPAYFSYWANEPVGQPRRREDVLRDEPCDFPGNGPYRVGLLRRGLARRQVPSAFALHGRPLLRLRGEARRPVRARALQTPGPARPCATCRAGARRSMPRCRRRT